MARLEWELWQALCHELVASGAVTEGDLASPVGPRGSPGLRVLMAAREWADAVRELALACAPERDGPSGGP